MPMQPTNKPVAYIKTTTGQYPVKEQEIKDMFPNVSFPTPFTASGYAGVFVTTPPSFNAITQKVVEVPPAKIDGVWKQQWSVVDLDAETISNNEKALIPASVSPRQIRQALTRFDLRTQVEVAVAAGDQDIKDWWEFALTIERKHPMVVNMAKALGIDDNTIDAIFLAAGTL